MEMLLGILAMVALGASVIGWLWIVVSAFTDGETLWGIGSLIISPLCLVYGFMNFDELKIPVLMVAAGFVSRIVLAILSASMA